MSDNVKNGGYSASSTDGSMNDCMKGIKPFQCQACEKRYFTKSDYDQHRRTHTTLYQCHICDREFGRSYRLKDHINFHTGLKPHICNVCNKRFSVRESLRRHKRKHSDEQTRPHVFQPDHYPFTILTEKDRLIYKCNVCRRKFYTEYNIMYHLASTTGVKAFNCELCGEGFISSRKFESHFRITHKNQWPFKRSLCKMGFPKLEYLLDHISNTETPVDQKHVCELNMNIDSEQIQGNVNTQEIAGETLLSPDPVDDSVSLLADSKDTFVDFGELANDVVWIDSEGFSTINDGDWNLLGGQKKHALVTDLMIKRENTEQSLQHLVVGENAGVSE